MAAVGTGPDILTILHSGAEWLGGHQSDASLCLGGFRASDRAQVYDWHRLNPLRGIRIVWASGGNEPGVGSLRAVNADTVRWTAPGDTAGTDLEIAFGETLVALSGTPSAYLIIERTSADDLAGIESVQIIEMLNNAFGGENFSAALQVTGGYQYHSVPILVNGTLTSASIEAATDNEALLAFAADVPGGDGAIQTITDVWTAPTGVSFLSSGSVGNKVAGDVIWLWIRVGIAAHQAGTYARYAGATITYVAGGVTYTQTIGGYFRVAETALAGYAVWHTEDAPPNPLSVSPESYQATTPVTVALDPGHLHYLLLAERNEYGVIGAYSELEKRWVAEDGSEEGARPHGPSLVQVKALAAGNVSVMAAYDPSMEDSLADRATEWRIYLTTTGIDPDPEFDTPTVVAMTGAAADGSINPRPGREPLVWSTSTAAMDGAPIKVLVRTAREEIIPGEEEGDPDTSVYWESENDTVYSATATYWGPTRPVVHVVHERGYAQALAAIAGPAAEVTYIDESENIRWVMGVGYTSLYVGDAVVLTFCQNFGASRLTGLFTDYAPGPWAASGSGSEAGMDASAWTELSKVLYVCVGPDALRLMKIDVTNQSIGIYDHVDPEDTAESRADEPCWPTWTDTVFQVWDPETDDYATVASLDLDGVLHCIGGISP